MSWVNNFNFCMQLTDRVLHL